MSKPVPPGEIQHRVQIRAIVRDGYRCRRCNNTVLDDADRYVALVKPNAPPDLHNVLTLCRRCHERHAAPTP